MQIAVAGASGTVGHHVVAAAAERGHQVVRLSRSDGVDLLSGDGLAASLGGTDVIIDVSNAGTVEERAASELFTAVAGNLQRAGAEVGVEHVVTLSIVGIEDTTFGYYRAKLAHEQTAQAGPVPATIVRATQLHEFPAQVLAMTRDGGRAGVFDVAVQTVAASAVAAALLDCAETEPQGRGRDVAGPERARLVDLARAFVEHFDVPVTVDPDTQTMAGVPGAALLPGRDARIVGPTFATWMSSPDAAAIRS